MFRFVTDPAKRGWDWLRRQLAIWIWDKSPSAQGAGPFNPEVVFIRWDAKLGDTIVLSWVWRELQRQRPDLKITVITGESFKRLFVQGYGIESVHMAPKRHGWKQLAQIAHQMSHPQYVVHLSLKWRARDIRFVRKLKAQHVVGLDDELKLVDIKLGVLTQGLHFSEKLVPWLEDIGVDTTDRSYWVARMPEARQAVDPWWPAHGRVIGLCPYGASKKKHLSDDWITRMVTTCLDAGLCVVMLVLPTQRPHIEHLITANEWGKSVTVNPGDSSQSVLFEQVARCDAIISVDTAVVHLAVGFSKPLLSIYNSKGEEFENWHPNDRSAFVLRTVDGIDASINALNTEDVRLSLQAFVRSVNA